MVAWHNETGAKCNWAGAWHWWLISDIPCHYSLPDKNNTWRDFIELEDSLWPCVELSFELEDKDEVLAGAWYTEMGARHAEKLPWCACTQRDGNRCTSMLVTPNVWAWLPVIGLWNIYCTLSWVLIQESWAWITITGYQNTNTHYGYLCEHLIQKSEVMRAIPYRHDIDSPLTACLESSNWRWYQRFTSVPSALHACTFCILSMPIRIFLLSCPPSLTLLCSSFQL